MKRISIYIGLLLLCSTLYFSCNMNTQTSQKAPNIDLEDFFRNPEKSSFSISADGSHYAFLAPYQDRMNVYVQKIGSDSARRLTSETDRDLAGYIWKGSNRILYIKDNGGDENFALFGVDIITGELRAYTNIPEVKTQIIDDLPDDDLNVILGLNERDARVFDAYRLNLETGTLSLIAENPGNISGWVTNHKGELLTALATDGVNTSVLYRSSEDSAFNEVITTNFKESFSPVFFDFADSNVMYGVSSIGRDKAALVRVDMRNGQELEVVFEDAYNDIINAAYSRKRRVLTSVYWYADKMNRHSFDAEVNAIYEELEISLPGLEVSLASRDREERNYIVRTTSDRTRGAYYAYDAVNKNLVKLADLSPWLNEDHMAEMKPITYKSRDGLTINGYLTLPLGVSAENLPVIINPHGGPWARDYWGFNPEVQFLANRGYAVLQMNFRGSVGYGRKFWEASFKQWGQAMQNDISDGVRYLVAEGIADQNKVAIYGGSYGGYATLAGVAFTPDLYTCAIDYVGVSNLFTFMETMPPYWSQFLEMMYEMVGDPEEDKAMLAAYSPALHADKIKTPLLIAQGANDPRVKQSESDQMVKALREKGVEVEYLLKENEGHGFHNQENRYEFYRASEKFLAKHMDMQLPQE